MSLTCLISRTAAQLGLLGLLLCLPWAAILLRRPASRQWTWWTVLVLVCAGLTLIGTGQTMRCAELLAR